MVYTRKKSPILRYRTSDIQHTILSILDRFLEHFRKDFIRSAFYVTVFFVTGLGVMGLWVKGYGLVHQAECP